MTKRTKYLPLAMSAIASWLAMLLVGTLAYIAGPRRAQGGPRQMIDWNRIAHPGPVNSHLAARAAMLMGRYGPCPAFDGVADSYDRWDRSHFDDRGIGRRSDVWDNRRKVVA